MNWLDIFLFIVKYTPFWAVPIGLMSTHFAYLYWIKDYREVSYIWGIIILFCLTSIIIYLLLGGPDKITNIFTHIFH
jgi:uncharacterized phage infection (PIP) family protein YhgE